MGSTAASLNRLKSVSKMLHIVLEVPFVFDMVLLSDQWVWNGLVVIAKKGNLLIQSFICTMGEGGL